jgi:hypothetical protein
MFGFGSKKKYEEEMAEWLAHPNEFGVRPKSVKHKRTFKGSLVGDGPTEIHLVEYVMPNGTAGRGFVNRPLTWSFLGDMSGISDDELLLAYCGWAWLFPRIQAGSVLTDFVSEGEEAQYIAKKVSEGFANIEVTGRYKIGTSELFEITGTHGSQPARAAGNTEGDTSIAKADPCYKLPPIYFFLGTQVIESMK